MLRAITNFFDGIVQRYLPDAFISAEIVNFFVPSGGGQCAVQGTIMISGYANWCRQCEDSDGDCVG